MWQTCLFATLLGRPIHDLRISVTDRCNFRCTYCMPREVFGRDYAFLPARELLTFEEIARLARLFVEPRRPQDPPDRWRAAAAPRTAQAGPDARGHPRRRGHHADDQWLAARAPGPGAGRRRSAAHLGQPRLARRADLRADERRRLPGQRVLDGIAAADRAGLRPIKVNMVVRRGVNEQDVVPMARYFRDRGHILRFIEYMDVGHTNGWRLDDVVPADEIVAAIDAHMPLVALPPLYPGEVADRWAYRDGRGEVGVIASVTQPFCRDCSRARLTADGQLYTCLFANTGHDLRGPVRAGASDDDLSELISSVWAARDDRYSELRSLATTRPLPVIALDPNRVEMSRIGG